MSTERRKPIKELTLQSVRHRLSSLLDHINYLAEKEEVDSRTITAYALQLVSNDFIDRDTSYVGKDIALKGKFSDINKQFPIDKAALILDMMEIGKRKYTDFRRLFLSERFSFPAYKNIASFRSDITLTNEVKVINNHGYSIGVGILFQTVTQNY